MDRRGFMALAGGGAVAALGTFMLGAGAASDGRATATVTIGTPTPSATPELPDACGNPGMRKAMIRQMIANKRAEIAALREALDDCDVS